MIAYLPSYCQNASQYPYIDRVSIGDEENCVDFVYQFAKDSVFDENSFWLYSTAVNIIGPPIKFQNYGYFPKTFVMKTYGFDISISPWQNERYHSYFPQQHRKICKDIYYVAIEFHEAVYPIRLSIYEICNPGYIIKIKAQGPDNQWYTLWDGSPEIVPLTSRLFYPPLQPCNFKTKSFILEFKHSSWEYYTIIDAVMLIGTSELILPKNPEMNLTNILERINCMHPHHENVNNLPANYPHLDIDHLQKNFSEYCIKSNIRSFQNSNFRQQSIKKMSLLKHSNNEKRMKLSSDEHCLSACPDEIILIILRNLDLITLCRIGQINKRFYNLTRDPLLYTSLNIRNMECSVEFAYMKNIFSYFTPRCKYLRQLDLTLSNFPSSNFQRFLHDCGSHLTHLRLYRCESVDNLVVLKISEICKNLKVLDLERCLHITKKGFSFLANLERLEYLNLSHLSHLSTQTLCKILQKNRRIRELILKYTHLDLDAVAVELKKFCQDIEIINFKRSRDITSHGINTIANCKNLRKVNIANREGIIGDDSLNRLFFSCQRLEEICLSYIVLTDLNLQLLTQCKNLKQLYLYQTDDVITPEKYSVFLEQCPKLQTFHLKYCKMTSYLAHQWKEKYPHVFIDALYEEMYELIIFL